MVEFGHAEAGFRRCASALQRGACSFGLLVAFLLGMISHANADICGALRSQLDGGGRSPEVAQLNKQLAAIRGFERQRKCSAGNSGGLFNACGDLARRRSQVEQKIQVAARSAGRGNAVAIRARMNDLGCAMARPQRRDDRQANAWGRGNAMLFCVRLTDGYFFPAPNSQFVGAEDYKPTLSRCQYICDERQMDVYLLNDGALESEEMLSIESRKPYRELASAFAYREAVDFSACDSQRYNRRVNEARARATTPKTVDADEVVLPVPEARPDVDGLLAYTNESASKSLELLRRKVRIVGVPYLPDPVN